jgi:hypothetical protein
MPSYSIAAWPPAWVVWVVPQTPSGFDDACADMRARIAECRQLTAYWLLMNQFPRWASGQGPH